MNLDALKYIYLYEYSPEAIEAVKADKAVLGPGAIYRKAPLGKGILERAKPAALSVADLLSLFESQENASVRDEQLDGLKARLSISNASIEEANCIAWLNHDAMQRLFAMNAVGFQKMIIEIERTAQGIQTVIQHMQNQYITTMVDNAETYAGYLKNDFVKMQINTFDIINSNISDHLDQITSYLTQMIREVSANTENSFFAFQIIKGLLAPYVNVVILYSSLFYYATSKQMMPGNYQSWKKCINEICKSSVFLEKISYYIHLKTALPFKNKIEEIRDSKQKIHHLFGNFTFNEVYIKEHTKEEYLSRPIIIRQKIEKGNYIQHDGFIYIALNGECNYQHNQQEESKEDH